MDTLNADPQTSRRRKAYKVAKELTLTDEERQAFATYILRRDITSWNQLSESQLERILDALEGIELFLELMRQRP